MRLQQAGVKSFRIQHIFISHLHGDHYFGLIGLLTTFHLLRRQTQLTIYAPPQLEALVHFILSLSSTTLCYPLHFVHTNTDGKHVLLDERSFSVSSFPVKHRIPTTGFIFEEKSMLRKINRLAVKGMELETEHYDALREGRDITLPDGRHIRNEELTLPAQDPRSYVFSADTLFDPGLAGYYQGANLLYHEATFMHDQSQRAFETFHSTARQAGEMAGIAGVQQLLIGHFSSKYPDLSPLLQEARQAFPNTFLAEEGKSFEVPLSPQRSG